MNLTLKRFLVKQRENIVNFPARRKIKNKNFTIISNNCWGGRVYQDLDIKYQSPFVGLFIYAPCYIELLQNLEETINTELKFIEHSKYQNANEERVSHYYPIGLLGNSEIHFLHYKDEQEAKEKWDRRRERINWANLFVKFSDRDFCEEEHLQRFDGLDFENKVCFTAKKRPDLKSSVQFMEFKNSPYVKDETLVYKKYFDVVKWLNNQELATKL